MACSIHLQKPKHDLNKINVNSDISFASPSAAIQVVSTKKKKKEGDDSGLVWQNFRKVVTREIFMQFNLKIHQQLIFSFDENNLTEYIPSETDLDILASNKHIN